tara:strand:+ start:18890 stop:19324 length:435 start_codon:yes stop_codon:yes gene_type:complete
LNNLSQRIISVILYTFPLKASIPFGYALFYKFSFLKIFLVLTLPIALIERSMPLGNLLLFLFIFIGLVRNMKVPYFVRFNACQSLLLNIAIIIFSYFLRIFPIIELGYILFGISLVAFIFSIINCIYGIEPEIPLISKSVRMQI